MTDDLSIDTRRLHLRTLMRADAVRLQNLAQDPGLSDTMLTIPHPFPVADAMNFIVRRVQAFNQGQAVTLAIVRREDDTLIGLVELRNIEREHAQAELSFWVERGLWGEGYTTEAIAALLRHGFEEVGLNRVYAYHMVRSPASGQVLEQNGFLREGVLRRRIRKNGVFEDAVILALLREEWEARNKAE